MKKKPQDSRVRFFCDKCGYEVDQDAKNCPGCGRNFSSVKCPACKFVGSAALFGDGCPVCGYSASKNADAKQQSAQNVREKSIKSQTETQFPHYQHGSLPIWIYIVTSVILLIAVLSLFFRLW
jgi:RNA polymerase subunit RPABC4/transcription elongation factor Spt4